MVNNGLFFPQRFYYFFNINRIFSGIKFLKEVDSEVKIIPELLDLVAKRNN